MQSAMDWNIKKSLETWMESIDRGNFLTMKWHGFLWQIKISRLTLKRNASKKKLKSIFSLSIAYPCKKWFDHYKSAGRWRMVGGYLSPKRQNRLVSIQLCWEGWPYGRGGPPGCRRSAKLSPTTSGKSCRQRKEILRRNGNFSTGNFGQLGERTNVSWSKKDKTIKKGSS